MKKFKIDSEKVTGGLLLVFGIGQLLLSSKKEKIERAKLEDEITSKVIEKLNS